jgi:phosphoglycolate phosphatase-like HAD superfamily hydrolase
MSETVLLFDIDGTLLRSARRRGYRDAVRQALEKLFGTYGRIDEVDFGGRTDLSILREALEPAGISPETIRERIGEWEAALLELTERLCLDGPLYVRCPGVGELVEALDADDRYTLSLLTGNLEMLAARKLAVVGLDHHFRVRGAYGGDHEDRNELPAIAAARVAAHAARDYAPSDFVIVGDTPRDVAAARHFGMRCVAVATGGFSLDDLAVCRPDALLPDLSDLDAALEAIGR